MLTLAFATLLLAAGCGHAPQASVGLPEPVDASVLPVGPRVRIEQPVGLPEADAIAWAELSGWPVVEIAGDGFFAASSDPSGRLILTIEDGLVVEAWAG